MDIHPIKSGSLGPPSHVRELKFSGSVGPVAGKPVRGVHGIVDKDYLLAHNNKAPRSEYCSPQNYARPRTHNNAGAVSPLREHMENINL